MRCEPQNTWSKNKEEIIPEMLRDEYLKRNSEKIKKLISHTIQMVNKGLSQGSVDLMKNNSIKINQEFIFPEPMFKKDEIDLISTWVFIVRAVQNTFTNWNVESIVDRTRSLNFRARTPLDTTLDKKSKEKKLMLLIFR